METAFVKTPLGIAELRGDQNGVSRIHILDNESEVTATIPSNLEEAVSQLMEYFAGKRREFNFKINLEGSDFQKSVWQQLLTIPYGTTVSYMDVTKKLGDVKAIRAVASANGKNPLWIVVPCHRVVGTNGSLTGYAGGLWRKKWLLDHENPSSQQSLF